LRIEKRSGEVFSQGNFDHAWQGALRRAGISDFHFHDLRHTFASHLAIAGVSILVIKELLGHKDLSMTMRYAHLSPDARKAAIMTLSKNLNIKPRC
jgi:integrase